MKKPIYLFLIVFLTTLQSIYFYKISLAPFPIIALFLLLIFNRTYVFERKSLIFFFQITSIIILNFLIIQIVFNPSIYWQSIIGAILGPLFFLFLNKFLKYFSIQDILSVLNFSILIHAILFLVQFSVFHMNGEVIDFLGPITGEHSRNLNNLGVIRSSGIFVEPQNYSLYLLALVLIKIKFQEKLDFYSILGILTSLFTFSLFGILSSIIMIIIIFYNKKAYLLYLINAIIVIGFIFFKDVFIFIYESRIIDFQNDSSFVGRYLQPLTIFMRDNMLVIFGKGLTNVSTDIRELTTLFQPIISFGIPIGLIFWLIIYRYLNVSGVKIKYIFIFFALMLGDLRIPILFTWLFISLLSFKEAKAKSTEKICIL